MTSEQRLPRNERRRLIALLVANEWRGNQQRRCTAEPPIDRELVSFSHPGPRMMFADEPSGSVFIRKIYLLDGV